ncbi:hypothetical protein B6D29_02665 [Microgenomates bacterium UTCPR1]|nr:MAG: hypothetical protein B6D29_02665 [Microgenomates bacterium UTCPR1]
MDKKPKIDGKIIKCSTMTLFLDTYEAKNKSKYLKITESRFDKNTKQSKRSSIFLFKEDLDKLKKTLEEIEL